MSDPSFRQSRVPAEKLIALMDAVRGATEEDKPRAVLKFFDSVARDGELRPLAAEVLFEAYTARVDDLRDILKGVLVLRANSAFGLDVLGYLKTRQSCDTSDLVNHIEEVLLKTGGSRQKGSSELVDEILQNLEAHELIERSGTNVSITNWGIKALTDAGM